MQDALECCGLRSVRDMAWPFQDKTHGVDACVVRYGRQTACLDVWTKEAASVLGRFVGVGGVGVVCKVSAAFPLDVSCPFFVSFFCFLQLL